MKGIILAGGAGTRLYPLTSVASKQLLPVYDKPLIYYPLATLMLGGIKEYLLISTPEDTPRFQGLLGDGSQWGLSIAYAVQEKPDGIARAFLIGEEFIGKDPVTLILGDNLFYGRMKLDDAIAKFSAEARGAMIFGYPVKDPERYGVVEFDKGGKVVGIEEKPKVPKSNYAVPGLYVYDNRVAAMARSIRPSARGELEITDLNNAYLREGLLSVTLLGRGIAWLDTGTHPSLLEASTFIHTIEARQGLKIACLEEIAYLRGFVTAARFKATVERMPKSPYKDYLQQRFRDEV
jgi:glucose-1-phosphate thymidylyltransferase